MFGPGDDPNAGMTPPHPASLSGRGRIVTVVNIWSTLVPVTGQNVT